MNLDFDVNKIQKINQKINWFRIELLAWGEKHRREEIAPENNVGRWNLTLFDFGAGVCTAKNPGCGNCILGEQCNYLNRR